MLGKNGKGEKKIYWRWKFWLLDEKGEGNGWDVFSVGNLFLTIGVGD